jgi:small subunit ribosomal protein S8
LVTRIKIRNILHKEIIVVTDTISDILTRIRNANMVKHQIVQIPATKISLEIARILKEEGFIEDFESYEENKRKYLLISLKYIGKTRNPVICKIERISKPGLRVYSNSKKLPKVLDNLGIAIISTSKGIMTNLKAKELGIGGEVLCYIW